MKKGVVVGALVYALTVITWLLSRSEGDLPLGYRVAQLIGALALTGFAGSFLISTRHRVIDDLFGGLDKAYVVHKWIGLSSVALAIVHIATLGLGGGEHDRAAPWARLPELGAPAMFLFVALGVTAVVARRLTYETWKSIHRFMPLPYVVGLIHYYGTSSFDPLGVSPFSLWMDLVTVAGLAAAVYSVFLYERIGFPHHYRVTGLRPVAADTVELTGRPVGRPLTYRPGQFTFLKFPPRRPVFPSHPFTLSAAPQPDSLQFTIKASGDHTRRLPDSITLGDTFAVSAAHGRFDYTRGAHQQVWIAGGVGITPFRSFYLSPIGDEYSIDFFYAYHGPAGAYLDELRALSRPNLRVHLMDDTVEGYLTAHHIEQCVAGPVEIYFCGPVGLRQSLRGQLKASSVQVRGFHYERFGFGR